jgi:hypothetical protein
MANADPKSDSFRNAVLNMERRAERQIYDDKLVKCFVPNRILDDLNTGSNQLLFGRRGVGKTHTLKAFLSQRVEQGSLCHYLDCTSFGSGIGADGSAKNVAIRFFAKFISTLSDGLLEDIVLTERPELDLQDTLLVALAEMSNLGAPKSVGETFDYAGIVRFTNIFLERLRVDRLTILLDEWAQIPPPSQPYFGEFLKRAFFSNPRVTVKIGVVDHTYRLSERVGEQLIGLERSGDIFGDVMMDRYFVWDQHETFVEQFFAEILYNHLGLELNFDLDLPAQAKARSVQDNFFTQHRVLSELCRAAEGNARDFLVLFGKAHARFRQQSAHLKIGLNKPSTAA